MENSPTSSRLPTLFSKFSHCSVILQYYSTYQVGQDLMIQLCKDSLQMWDIYKKAFNNGLEMDKSKREIIEFEEDFRDEFGRFMLEKGRYMQYQLKVKVTNKETFTQFGNFLKSEKDTLVKNASNEISEINYMIFNEVYMDVDKIGIEAVNILGKHLREINISYECLRYENPSALKSPESEGKIEYIRERQYLQDAEYYRNIGGLDLTFQEAEIEDINYMELLFPTEALIDRLKLNFGIITKIEKGLEETEEPPKFLQNVTAITITDLHTLEMSCLLKEDKSQIDFCNPDYLKKIFPNLKTLDLQYSGGTSFSEIQEYLEITAHDYLSSLSTFKPPSPSSTLKHPSSLPLLTGKNCSVYIFSK